MIHGVSQIVKHQVHLFSGTKSDILEVQTITKKMLAVSNVQSHLLLLFFFWGGGETILAIYSNGHTFFFFKHKHVYCTQFIFAESWYIFFHRLLYFTINMNAIPDACCS